MLPYTHCVPDRRAINRSTALTRAGTREYRAQYPMGVATIVGNKTCYQFLTAALGQKLEHIVGILFL